MANGCNSLPWTFSIFFPTCLYRHKFLFYLGHTSSQWGYTTYYTLPVFSRYFKQFLQSFPIIHITGIPYYPQAQDIVRQTHHIWKLQIKKFKKGEYTGTLLSSLYKADFTRFQHKIFSKPIPTVNTALFVLKFLNSAQGDILTRAEKHFEELKDTSLPLPNWYQDESRKNGNRGN